MYAHCRRRGSITVAGADNPCRPEQPFGRRLRRLVDVDALHHVGVPAQNIRAKELLLEQRARQTSVLRACKVGRTVDIWKRDVKGCVGGQWLDEYARGFSTRDHA